MPELPDITLYIEALEQRIQGSRLEKIRLQNPFLLRSVEPVPDELERRNVVKLRRLGKRIAIGLEGDYWLIVHLMIAGRLHWKASGAKLPKGGLAAFDFSTGTLTLTEAGSKRRAALYLVRGTSELESHNPAGLEVFGASRDEFAAQLAKENHTLKRSLTDPRLFSGIGNAYSDEILHAACLSPLAQSRKLTPEETDRLFEATRSVLASWTDRLREEAGKRFPERVTAFHEGMAAHGRFGQPCPVCATLIQRIRYAENETNYCPRCQTQGRVLADRSLSRLLKEDWPRSIEELEERGSGNRS